MKAQRLTVVLIVGIVVVSTGAGVLLYSGGSDIGSNSQSNSDSTDDDVSVLNQSADGKVYLDVTSDPQRDRADLGHALDGLYDEKSINVSNIDVEANTITIATDGRSSATYIADWIEQHLDHPQANADSDSPTDSETTSPQAQCGVEPTYYQIDFVAGEPIEELQGPKGTYTPDELIRFAHSNSEKSDIRRSSNGEFTTNESLRNAVDSKSIHVEDGTAKVSFSISEDSAPVKLTLASYTKPQRIWTRATEHQQEFIDADTRTFKPGGSYTLSVDLPDSKVVPCETDTAPEQPDSSTETDSSESPGTPQSSTPDETSETATSDTTPETTEAAPETPETATADTTTSETTSGTTTAETTNPGTTDAPPTTTPPTETPSADLGVRKTVDDANATVGENVTFTIDVTNNGPDAASNVSVDEMLGSGLEYQSGEVSQGVYDPVTGVYSVDRLANGKTATLEITATIKSSDNTTNAVEVTSDTPDPNDPNNTNSADPSPKVADLSLTKNVDESSPNVGENVEYTLTLSNDGPNATSNVSVADELPDGLSYVSSDASRGEYNNGTGLWSVGSLSDGGEASLAIVATVEGSDDITNIAEVNSSDTYDPDSTPDNNESDEDDQDNVTVDGQEADLAVTKTVNETNATVGDNVTFTVEVTNNGPDAATGVSVIESLNSGLSYQSAETTQGEYNEETNVYEVGTLESGETATLTLTALIESVDNTSNAVSVTGETPDPDPGNNTNTSDPNPEVADLSVTKDVNESAPDVGDNVAFTIDLTNNGPNATSNVTVADALPEGVNFVSADAGQGSYNAESGIWSVGSLANGDGSTLTIVASVQSAENETNIAEVNSSDTHDPDSTPDNNDSEEDDQDNASVNGQQADLGVTKTVNTTNTTVNDTVAFTVDVTNNGPDTATNVTVNEDLGDGLTFAGAETTQGEYNEETGVYDVGTLESGKTETLTLTALIENADNTTNAVNVTGDQPDPNDPNDNTTADPNPKVADLELTKDVNESVPNVGDNVAFTIDLTNTGPNATSDVMVADALPENVTFVSADAGQGSYDDSTGVWTVGELSNGDSSTLTIVASVESAENVTNTAQVNSSDVYDPDSTPDNNESDEDDQDDVTINGQEADLAVTKTVEDSSVTVGDNVTFTVDVMNNGPDTATGVSVIESLNSGLSYQSAETTQGEYDEETNVYEVDELENGETATLTLTALIESVDNTSNAVSVTGEQPDPDPGNNTNTSDPNPEVADLSVTKDVNESAPDVGDNVAFTIDLTNNGPDATSNVTVADVLPDNVTFVSADAGQGSYDDSTGIWTVGELSNGDGSMLTIIASVESSGNTTNTVQVNSSDVFDPDSTPDNNESDEDDQDNSTINPTPVIDLELNKTANVTSASVGSDVEYTVNVTNDGPSDATGVTVSDTLPEGIDYKSASTEDGDYSSETNTWNVGSLGEGSDATLTITGTVTATGEQTNVAQVSEANENDTDSEPGNDNSSEDDQDNSTVTTTPMIDLAVNKTVDDSMANVGDSVMFTVNVSNDGPSDATGVTVSDTLPEGIDFKNSSTETGSYSSETGNWVVGSLDEGSEATLTINGTVKTDSEQTNVAQVSEANENDTDSEPANDDSSEDDQDNATVEPNPVIDLSVNKTANVSSPSVGSGVAFTVNVSNDGPSDATGVTVSDTLPEGIDYESASTEDGSYNVESGNWNVGSLAADNNATLTINGTVRTDSEQTNIAQVSAANENDTDSDPGNDEPGEDDQDNATIDPGDLGSIGDTVYRDENRNGMQDDGEAGIEDVTVQIEYPDGTTQTAQTNETGYYDFDELPPGNYTVTPNGSTVPGEVTLTTQGVDEVNLSQGEDYNDADFGYGENVVEACYALADNDDALGRLNLTDASETPVGTIGPDGQDIEAYAYQIDTDVLYAADGGELGTVDTNNAEYNGIGDFGDADGSNGEVTISDVDGITFDPADNTLYGAERRGGLDLLFKANATTGKVVEDGFGNGNDYVPIPAPADKNRGDIDDLAVAEDGTLYGVANGGSDSETNVLVEIDKQTGESSVVGQFGVSDVEGLGFTDDGRLYATTGTDDALYLVDKQDGTATEVGPLDGNDYEAFSCARDSDESDLRLNKTVNNTAPATGSNVEFTLTVTNDGPDPTANVAVTETLPEGLEFVSASPEQANYNAESGRWAVGTLIAGEEATLSITATVNSTESVTNTAQVTSSGNTDPNSTPANNESNEDDQDNATVTPTSAIDLAVNKTVDDSTPSVGDTVTFTVNLSNAGPSDATGVVVADALPDGVEFANASTETGSYSSETGTWGIETLGEGNNATLTINATVTSAGELTNVAEVSAANENDTDSTPDNDVPSEDDQDNATITSQQPPGSIGDTVFNDGNRNGLQDEGESGIEGVTVTLEFPNGTTQTTQTNAGGTYEFSGLPPGDYTATADSTDSDIPDGLTLTTQGTDEVNLSGGEDYTDADFGYGSEVAERCYALADDQDTLSQINLTNAEETNSQTITGGGSDIEAYAYQINTDILYAADEGSGGSSGELGTVNPTTGEYTTIGEFGDANGPDGEVTINDPDGLTFDPAGNTLYGAERRGGEDLLFKINASTGDVVEGGFPDANDDGNREDYVPIPAPADNSREDIDDLSVTEDGTMYGVANGGHDSPSNALVTIDKETGQSNLIGEFGVSDVEGLGVTDDGRLYATTGTDDALYLVDRGTGEASEVGPLNAGTDYEAFSCARDSDESDLSLDMAVNNTASATGSNVTFNVTVTNNGPDSATRVAVKDTLPDGLEFVSAEPAEASYNAESGRWAVGTLASNEEATLSITASVKGSGEVTNTAQVMSSSNTDPNSISLNDEPGEDDQDSATVTPQASGGSSPEANAASASVESSPTSNTTEIETATETTGTLAEAATGTSETTTTVNTETETPTEKPSETTEATPMANTTTAAPTTEPSTTTSEAAETALGTEYTTTAP